MAMPPIGDLLLFMALVLVLSLYGLAAAGHFPREHRAPSLGTESGALILWGTMVLAVALTACTLVLAWVRLPIYAAVIGGGGMLLAAPLVLQPFPDTFVNGRSALLALSGAALILGIIAFG